MKQHVTHYFKNSFTAKYNCEQLVYVERYSTITEAIAREKQIKKYSRTKKDNLINALNLEWRNLLNGLDDYCQ